MTQDSPLQDDNEEAVESPRDVPPEEPAETEYETDISDKSENSGSGIFSGDGR